MRTAANRIICCLLAMLMLLACTACAEENDYLEREELINELYGSVPLEKEDENALDATTSHFTLAYSRKDTMNPYMCTSTLNSVISDLIYDQLIFVNSEFEAELVIANEISYTSSRLMMITLRDGIVFSDGSRLTAEDIVYSYECAKAKGSRYEKQLASITSCAGVDNTVYFRLAAPDVRAYMLLDFPIIKKDTDKNGAVPIGSGRYVYINDPVTGTYLLRNEKWYSANASKDIVRISLTTMPTVESLVSSIEIGIVSYYYTDLRDGYPTRLNANYSTVDINNLVYLGINTTDSRLRKTEVRSAMYDALNREEIITNVYAGRAYAATGIFTTSWPTAAAVQTGSTLSRSSDAIKTLEAAGYVNLDENYIRYNTSASSDKLSFELIVNEENAQQVAAAERIAAQLKSAGILIRVKEVSYLKLRERIAAGDYDLYLAEYALLNNMDISALFTPNLGYYYGLTPEVTIAAWTNFRNGQSDLSSVIEAYNTEIPFIPVCYRLGMVCYFRSMEANMNVTESDFFRGMHLWNVSLAESE